MGDYDLRSQSVLLASSLHLVPGALIDCLSTRQDLIREMVM